MALDWIMSMLGSGAVAAALLAAAGYLGRTHLAHWLSRDLEKIKAQHARDLEAYKVSLIAETERAKAAQAVRKSGAMRVIEKKFAALDALHRAVTGLAVDLLSAFGSAIADGVQATAAMKRLEVFSQARDDAAIFLTMEQKGLLTRYQAALNQISSAAVEREFAAPSAEDQEVLSLRVLLIELEVDAMVHALVHDMQSI